METILFFGLALFLLSGGVLAKNKIEDEVTTASDSFTRYDDLFKKYGNMYGVPWQRLKAIAMNESSLGTAKSVAVGLANPSDVDGSKSSDGKSWGLMQVTLTTGSDYDEDITPQALNNPDYSVDIAAQLVRDLQKQFDPSDERWEEWVIKSYNQGAGNTRKEMSGEIDGYAQSYWERYTRNRNLIRAKQGG